MWFQIISLLFAQGVLAQATATLVARVSVGGVKGTVTFSQVNPGEAVTVTLNLGGPNLSQVSSWQLHAFRLNYEVTDRCEESSLGPRILPSVDGGTGTSQTISGLELTGRDSIEGRSIVLLSASGSPVACATIESQDSYITARGTFRHTVLGHVIFRQLAASPSSLTRVTADLYSDGSESSARELEWRVVEGGGCSSVGTAYNPGGASGVCSSQDHSSCAVGNLDDKLGSVAVGATMGSSRMTAVDLNLPLSGNHRVLGKSVQLFVSGQSTPIACATILEYTTRTGIATFDNDGVTGTITLTQPSPFDPVTTIVDLNNLRSLASGYHIHKYPVPLRVTKEQSLCSDPVLSGHFNPFGVIYDADSPAAATSTEDMYEVGDLSKKYGLLDGSDSKSANYTDFNLSLFGINSVLGRSLVLHYNQPGAPRWVCANIYDTAALNSVLATFTYPVIGHVLLQQRTGDPEAETSIYYRLDYGDGVSQPSSGHSWAVHSNAVGPDMLSVDASSRCSSAMGVINPLSVSQTNYDTQCQPSDPLRCLMGDLKGKHLGVSIRVDASTPALGFFTDVNLPLDTVEGKSLVLKAANGGSGILACANLLKVWPQVVEAKSWGDGQTDYGTVTFSQVVGVVQTPTIIDINLQSLPQSGTVSYTVDNRPVSRQNSEGSRCSNLGGVYNPFEASASSGTKDQIAVGSLSTKFGTLTSSSGSDISRMDPTLAVWGPRGVTGRALSLASSGGSLGCADIVHKRKDTGRLFSAKAVFTGEVVGHIMMTQYVYPNGAMMPTVVVVDLRKASGTQTLRHNWHTHEFTVNGDEAATPGRCASTGQHYNPFRANTEALYAECQMDNPLRCELGDQSNKLGTYDMGSGPMVASDVYLPLTGPHGVVGRSFVVHVPNRGPGRLACADIIPMDTTYAMTMSIRTPSTMDKAPMVSKIAESISVETYEVAVMFLSSTEDCLQTRVYFLGMDAESNLQKFNTMIGSNPDALGEYKPVNECVTGGAGVALASVILLVVSVVTGRLLMG